MLALSENFKFSSKNITLYLHLFFCADQEVLLYNKRAIANNKRKKERFMDRARTDLALESMSEYMEKYAHEHSGKPDGVTFEERYERGAKISEIEILNEAGEKTLGRAKGKYVTLEFEDITVQDFAAFSALCSLCGRELQRLCGGAESALICGVGNSRMAADSLGPSALGHVLVTRSLRLREPNVFLQSGFADISAIAPGVEADTGFCTAEIVRSAVETAKPDIVIAIDALAARSTARLCKTVQISTSGVSPGSGVGNARARLDKSSAGAPVISLGVPTVVDVATLVRDAAGNGAKAENYGGLFVCPADIDVQSRLLARLVGFAVNIAFHKGYTIEEMLLG